MAYFPEIPATGSTTNATPLVIYAIPAIADGDTARVTYKSFAQSGTNIRTCTRTATFKNVAGTVTQVGAVLDIVAPVANAALSTAACTFQVTANAVQVVVTGVIATNIDWIVRTTIDTYP